VSSFSNKTFTRLSDKFKSYFAWYILWHFCDFVTYLPLALHHRHVWCYVHRSIQYLLTRQVSALYNNISCLTSPQSTLLFVSSDSGSHAYPTSGSSSLRTDERHTCCRNTTCYVFAFAAPTRYIAVVFLWKASAVFALLPVDLAGTQMDKVYPLKCH
jgi:hypothetical protein